MRGMDNEEKNWIRAGPFKVITYYRFSQRKTFEKLLMLKICSLGSRVLV